MLIGLHAYGVLLNRLGIRATPYATEDIDIARREALAFKKLPERGFLEMLQDSGIPFVEVPEPDRKKPSTSFKQRGRSRFHVDLLVPSANDNFPVVAVPELKAHATGLPYLDYLLSESQTAMLMAREGCCSVRVPLPERFAVHKLLVSRLRTGREAKSGKDVFQACVLCAALAESHPGAVESAVAKIPQRARKYLKPALETARRFLDPSHARAWEELDTVATRKRR
ncbi:MAG: nucleotidyltransferase domain-containing protein [Comamonadaceae bacterium]|nr:nucleotidyltransferase domain-containing protein [Comamonadaceae bacterium]